jgi:hypothetical protein
MARRGCPICGRPTAEECRPFCSKRCADIDLGRWFGEAYRIPVAEEEESEQDGEVPDGAAADRPLPPPRKP